MSRALRTVRYDFGGAARLIGRVAMNRLDVVRIGTSLLSKLRDDLQETVFLGMWTPQGPMVIEWLDNRSSYFGGDPSGVDLGRCTHRHSVWSARRICRRRSLPPS